jgi:hypothetical protein
MEEIESLGSALHTKDRGLEDLERWASLATATAVIFRPHQGRTNLTRSNLNG